MAFPDGEMLSVGPYVFRLSAAVYQSMQRSSEWRWATVERFGSRVAKQNVGRGEDTIRLSGVVFAAYNPGAGVAGGPGNATVGAGQIEAMRSVADQQVPLQVVDGAGRVYGKFIITKVDETASTFFRDGTPRKQEFNLELQRYGDEGVRPLIQNGRVQSGRLSNGGTLGSGVLGLLESLP